MKEELYPYILVNLRSGATFTRVDSPTEYKRLLGTSIGSSFFWGVLRLLNKFHDPTDAIDVAIKGDTKNIDMCISDIYGKDGYSGLGFKADMVASSFGKLKDLSPEEIENLKDDVRLFD